MPSNRVPSAAPPATTAGSPYIPKPGRSMWSGAISFGLVTIPVKLYPSVSEQNVAFTTLHAGCNAKLAQQFTCTACAAVVSGDERIRAFDVGNQFVTISDDELDDIPQPTKSTITVDRFVDLDSIDLAYFDKNYTVLPEPMGLTPFTLFMAAMRTRGVAGIGRVTIRTRESVCAIRAVEGGLALSLLHYAAEVRSVEAVVGYPLNQAEFDLAVQVIDALHEQWQPEQYHNTYREAVHGLVQSKVQGGVLPKATPSVGAPAMVDFVAALRATVLAATAARQPAPSAPVAPATVTPIAPARAKRTAKRAKSPVAL